MEKKTIYALVALAVLSVVAIVVMRAPEKGERVGERPRAFPEIKAGAITTLEITQPGGKDAVTITKKGDKWQVTQPYDRPADQAAVKSAVEGLEKVKWGDISTEQKDRQADLEVNAATGMHVVAKGDGKTLCDIYIGKSVGGATMVRVEGQDAVWQALDLMPYQYKKDAKAWRDHAIFDLKADEAEKVTLKGGGASLTLEHLPPAKGTDGKEGAASIYDAKWKVAAGDDKVKPAAGQAIDDGLVNGIVQTLANLRAADFLDNAKPEEYGLAPSQDPMEVSVAFKGGKTAGLRIGSLKGEDYAVQALDSPQIYQVKKYALERAAHLPQDIRDKTLAQLKADDIQEITVQQGTDTLVLKRADKGWKADKVADLDDNKAKSLAESFSALSGSGFVAPGSPELASLAKPKATVTVKPKTGTPLVLKIGDTRGDDVVVQRAGMDPVWVKKYSVERILKKPADLAKDKK